QVLSADLATDPETLEGEERRVEMLDGGVFDCDLAARDRRKADEGADLDVVTADAILAPVQAIDALDLQDVRPDPRYAGAHRVQHVAEILYVRLGRCVSQPRRPLGEDGRHDRVLGGGHAGLVEEHVRPSEAV